MKYSPEFSMTLPELARILRFNKPTSGRRVYTWILEENGKRVRIAKMPYAKNLILHTPPNGRISLEFIAEDPVWTRIHFRVRRDFHDWTVSTPWAP